MKNLIKPIFILTSLYALVGCTNPSLFNHDYVDVNFQDGNKTKTIRFEIGAKFGDLFNESPKRGCILTHFEDEKGNSYYCGYAALRPFVLPGQIRCAVGRHQYNPD